MMLSRPGPAATILNLGWLQETSWYHLMKQVMRGASPQDCYGTRSFHLVYHTQMSRYFEWQSQFHYFTWIDTRQKPYANYTRLVTGCAPDPLFEEMPSFLAAPHPLGAQYGPIDKPFAIHQWMQRASPQEDIIVIVDSDCLPIADISKYTRVVREGQPLAQQGYMLEYREVFVAFAKKYCPQCAFWQPLAVPYLIHRRDLEKILPRWVELCEIMIRDSRMWPSSWREADVALTWTLEMFAYIFAAAELNLTHLVFNNIQVLGVDRALHEASFIHYSTEILLGPEQRWNKKDLDAVAKIPWPLPSSQYVHDVQITLFHLLHNARNAVGSTGHVYPGSYYQGVVYPNGCP
jgi:hypothetical protein